MRSCTVDMWTTHTDAWDALRRTRSTWPSVHFSLAARAQSSIPAPVFSMPDLTGTLFQLSEARGRVVVIDFMATWCGPCRAAMPHLGAIWEHYNETIVMISIDIDPVESEATLQQYANEFPYETWLWAKARARSIRLLSSQRL